MEIEPSLPQFTWLLDGGAVMELAPKALHTVRGASFDLCGMEQRLKYLQIIRRGELA